MGGRLGKAMKDMEKARAKERATARGGKAINPNKGCPGCGKMWGKEAPVSRQRHLDECAGV
jgi:hypothetical protein